MLSQAPPAAQRGGPMWPSRHHERRTRPGCGHRRSRTPPSTDPSSIAPRCRESTPSAGLSLTSHQPGPPESVDLRESTRLTARMPSGKRASTTSAGRGGRRYWTSSRSPGCNVGVIDRPRTRARPHRATCSTRSSVAVDRLPAPTEEDLRMFARLFAPTVEVSAHCDLPCGVYDPAQARIEAESIKAIIAKVADNDDPDFRTRAVLIKEQRSELVKHHLWVLWTDYFKPPHFEKYPQLHTLVNEATKLAGASGTKGEMDAGKADELLAKIDEIAEIFWETKKA